jgi:hypothetical protein
LLEGMVSVTATEAAAEVVRVLAGVSGREIHGKDWLGGGAVAADGFFGRGNEG